MKEYINIFESANEILSGLKKGALVTTKVNDKVNTMTISWGMIGIEWNKPIFITFVRESRFTREMLDNSTEFSVSIPICTSDFSIGKFCGLNSGRDVDKIKLLNLNLLDGEIISTPVITNYPIILECKILYKQLQDKNAIPVDINKAHYPEHIASNNPLSNKDYHISYYAEIVKAYIIKSDN